MEGKQPEKEMERDTIRKTAAIRRKPRDPQSYMCPLIAIVVIVVVLLVLLSMSIVNVPAGHKGVIVNGFNVGDQLDEGWQLKNPLSGVEMVRYNTQYQKTTVSVLTNDGYNVPVDIQIVYHLKADKVGEIREENPDFVEAIILNEVRSQLRKIVAKGNYTGEAINLERTTLEGLLGIELEGILSSYHIIMEDVNIRNIDLPPTILTATEQRQAAKVAVQTAKYNLEAAEYNAEQKVVTARAERNVTVIEAQAQADAQTILANQSKEMNETVMNFIMFMKWVNMLKDPDCNVEFYIVPEGVPVILDPSEIKG
jgi:regulator of protease activity HflC (stomatin/prohibitin superfamily)